MVLTIAFSSRCKKTLLSKMKRQFVKKTCNFGIEVKGGSSDVCILDRLAFCLQYYLRELPNCLFSELIPFGNLFKDNTARVFLVAVFRNSLIL